MDIVNLATGQVTAGPQLPTFGSDGCAAVHEGYLYWVRGHGGYGYGEKWVGNTQHVYRATSKSCLGLCLVASAMQLFVYIPSI